jgi:hypothetical protein
MNRVEEKKKFILKALETIATVSFAPTEINGLS